MNDGRFLNACLLDVWFFFLKRERCDWRGRGESAMREWGRERAKGERREIGSLIVERGIVF